jgi:hypothetical protein
VATPEELEIRVATLESLVSKLTGVATRAYIALRSVPYDIRKQDPDFDKNVDLMSKGLDEIFDILINKKEATT